MKRTFEDFSRLVSELESSLQDFEYAVQANERASQRIAAGANDQLDYAALGYTIHNIYGVIEGYCLRIAKFFENNIDPASWHRGLLDRMGLNIEGVRPALFSGEEVLVLHELRSFHHVFRHLYARPLDADKLELVQRRVPRAADVFRKAHARYVEILRRLGRAVGGGIT
jgi:hypothetical protein